MGDRIAAGRERDDLGGAARVSGGERQPQADAQSPSLALGDGRVHLVANFSDPVPERGADAAAVVKAVASVVGGGGGGRPTMARAGGKDPEKLGEALALAERTLVEVLSVTPP